jgi:hypothetical protein
MRDYGWCITNEEGMDTLLEFFLRHAHALVLPKSPSLGGIAPQLRVQLGAEEQDGRRAFYRLEMQVKPLSLLPRAPSATSGSS